MVTKYPGNIDDLTSLPKVTDLVSPIVAEDHNSLRDAIVGIENELGTDPSGVYGTVKDRLNFLSGAPTDAIDVNLTDADGYFVSANVEGALLEVGAALALVATTAGVIGDAEDGIYTDGLFTDFIPTTPVGTAIDRFNEILAGLSPPPPPALSDQSFTSSIGVAGKVSFGTSNAIAGYSNVGTAGGGSALDINGSFTSGSGTALRKGLYNNSTTHSGIVADAVVADTGTPTPSYPANAFADGYDGYLGLIVNGLLVHSVDLTVFGSGSSLNGNGSGFTSVSAGTPVKFPSGASLALFNYRTANWVVDPADQRNGWNYAQIIHDDSPSFTRLTNYFEWVVDANVTATSYSGEVLDTLAMTGSSYLSGVEYHTGGTAQYDLTIDNVHRNTYSSSGTAISHPTTTNCSVSSTALGTIAAESDSEVLTNQTVTVAPDTNNRILNGSLTVNSRADRTVQTDANSSGQSIAGILVDSNSDTSTATDENLNGEDYRVPSNRVLTDTSGFTSGGAGLWDKTISLVSATAGYLDGLLVYDGQLFYPNDASVTNSGNFSTITNGPAANVDYSAATGARVYWRYYYFAGSTSNFILRLNGTGTVVNAGSVTGSTNQFSVEFLLPNTTQNGGGTIEFKDANIAYTDINSIGCYASTYGSNVGSVAGSDWGISFGSRNTSTSGNAVVIRISTGAAWTGDISNIEFVAA